MRSLPEPTETAQCQRRLKQLRLHSVLTITRTEATPAELQSWYHAARKERMKISIRNSSTGAKLWRLA